MFATSSQCRYWIYSDDNELLKIKQEANAAYIEKHGRGLDGEQISSHFLTTNEEIILVQHAECALKAFCQEFKPRMPPSVMACAVIYLKRIYLKHSVMDFKPNDIIPTCVYLACKVDEFNVSLREFVANLKKKDRDRVADLILWFELPIMQLLNYQLTVHSAYRSLEGLFINLKTHCPDIRDPDSTLRGDAESFLDQILKTNAYLLHAPSQVALAALVYSTERKGVNLRYFLNEHLMRGCSHTQMSDVLKRLSDINRLHNNVERPSNSRVREISEKLERCRNQEYNPNSAVFQKRVKDLDDDDDFVQLDMYKQDSQEQLSIVEELMTK